MVKHPSSHETPVGLAQVTGTAETAVAVPKTWARADIANYFPSIKPNLKAPLVKCRLDAISR